MDVRTWSAAQPAIATLNALNACFPWSHNDHFHGWILADLPPRRFRALDVGCGQGELAAKLAESFEEVDAADCDPAMRTRTKARCAGLSNVTVIDDFAAATGTYDLITMIAVLHHLDLVSSLTRCAELLTSGGRLRIVGLARPETIEDNLWRGASAIANPIMGILHNPIPTWTPAPTPPFPVQEPEETFDQISLAAHRILPGSRIRRRIPFRYSLSWTKPGLPDGERHLRAR